MNPKNPHDRVPRRLRRRRRRRRRRRYRRKGIDELRQRVMSPWR